MGLIIGFFALYGLVVSCKSLYRESKVFRAIADFFHGLYSIVMLTWFITEWVKTDFGSAFMVLVVMTLPMIVFDIFGIMVPDKSDMKIVVEGSPKKFE